MLPLLLLLLASFPLQVTGTKAELVLRLLGAFNLSAPAKAPAQLLRALLLERSTLYDAWDGPDTAAARQLSYSISHTVGAVVGGLPKVAEAKSRGGVAGARAAISAAGYMSMAAYQAAMTAAYNVHTARMREEAARREAEHRAAEAARRAAYQQQLQQRAEQRAAQGQLMCACGNAAAAACTRRCCGICCKREGGCDRHKVGFAGRFGLPW